jgi:hypothetical protein
MCKEVFINVNDGCIKWWGPGTSGSEPTVDLDSSTVLGNVIKMLMDLSRARGEDWSFRINRQPKV